MKKYELFKDNAKKRNDYATDNLVIDSYIFELEEAGLDMDELSWFVN